MTELSNRISIGDMLLVSRLAYEGIEHDELLMHKVLTSDGTWQQQGYWMYNLSDQDLKMIAEKIEEYNSGNDLVDPKRFNGIKVDIRKELMARAIDD